MKSARLFISLVILSLVVQYLMPVFGAQNRFLFETARNNCGAVRVVIASVTSPLSSSVGVPELVGVLACGGSLAAFIVLPGILTVVAKLTGFVKHG